MPESLVELLRENWLIFVIVYLVKPDLIYNLFGGLLSKLGLINPDPNNPQPDGPVDLIDLLAELLRRNVSEGLGADKEIQALMAKITETATGRAGK